MARNITILSALVLWLVGGMAAQAPAQPALVVLVRHAERAATPADDPGLTKEGMARAEALAVALERAGVTAIITSELRRTRETAAPLAKQTGVKPEVVSTSGSVDAHAKAVATAVRKHPKGVVVVVGHSNTVPAIITALGGPKLPDICDTVFGNMFVLTPTDARPHLVRARYGAADPPAAPGCQ